MGLGVDDPKGGFGTTLNLHKTFKNNVLIYLLLKMLSQELDWVYLYLVLNQS